MCRFSWNLGASTSWKPQGLSRSVKGLLYPSPKRLRLLFSGYWELYRRGTKRSPPAAHFSFPHITEVRKSRSCNSTCRSPWPRGVSRRLTAARLLGLVSNLTGFCLSVVSIVGCQVEVSATGRSLVQRSPTDWCVWVGSRNLDNEAT